MQINSRGSLTAPRVWGDLAEREAVGKIFRSGEMDFEEMWKSRWV